MLRLRHGTSGAVFFHGSCFQVTYYNISYQIWPFCLAPKKFGFLSKEYTALMASIEEIQVLMEAEVAGGTAMTSLKNGWMVAMVNIKESRNITV